FPDNAVPYPWSNAQLSWQRTAFHFQPERSWMSDPDGPIFYKGWYHFFYQYNPDNPVWGNNTWGHTVSRDLIHWLYLPLALAADQWYDMQGVFSGSATCLPDGRIMMLYTGVTKEMVEMLSLAYPADLSDPLLVEWVKYPGNPILSAPPGVSPTEFRDASTGWYVSNGTWRIAIGAKYNTTGIAMVYETKDFKSFKLLEELLHAVPDTGLWECVDLYPVSTTGEKGLETSVNGPKVKHVLKASIDEQQRDYYAIGTYDLGTNKWTPDNPEEDVGIGLRYDWGKYYASKTFYDPKKQRRVVWAWTKELDSEVADREKGWANVQTIPRTVLLDQKTGTNVLLWPVEEVESLRLSSKEFSKVKAGAGSVVPLDVGTATQLDIIAEFEIDKEALEGTIEADMGYNCTTSGGAAERGVLGPFGLLVSATENLSEQTPVYFYIAKGTDGNFKTFFCLDESRSSKASDVSKQVKGFTVPVLDGEKFTMRLLVDHSIVESFAQGGRSCITSRVYPTEAIYGAAKLFLFNNATGASITASLKIWEMNSAFIQPFHR
nr:Chain A, Sucrose:(Sucrose/fructan) 6-fructosyltransferase [Pachysandra terminalis]3UGF_B Chain B, Sucrose:(Sucrose/fructan) 6-fructosyltransferase [Pachysandra terminalis]3UGG_A Chain A, Sucrose:(Sucrose/fructan) 6-fructosyltransferase [Pachysandra terminalis]3UGG_B Chain B, Sucrose:(Sucrose/fructan) 6-fructosyltransferase [Pachysandra terminalis]3UGH_A Chain A, Sucrose:(Sucrose/fructan) 6-fructosyltransferase [Pachysandra terminalis]3UGH_B Chain B, Sucrose:(Sucrose/fructan) 6-fructosyltran